MERFEARLEVDSQEAVADSNLKSCSVSHMVRFVGNKAAGNILVNNRFPDEAEVAVDHNSHRDSEDMLDNALDAWVASSRAVEGVARIDRAAAALNRHLYELKIWEKEEEDGK